MSKNKPKNNKPKDNKPKILAVLGPTSVGKSELGLELSKLGICEIVSADSLQVYKHLNIGTSKPSQEALSQVPHHLIDIREPDAEFNAGVFKQLAEQVINNLHNNGSKVILVGGTFLYVRVLLYGLVEGMSSDPRIRLRVKGELEALGSQGLFKKLLAIDPVTANTIHPNDHIRIGRALEVFYQTGKPISSFHQDHKFPDSNYDCLKIGLLTDREEIRRKIDIRTDEMVSKGLEREVRELLEMGYSPNLKPLKSIGYAEMISYIEGEITLQTAIELIKRNTKRLAKRQMTWLRKEKDVCWFQYPKEKDKIYKAAEEFLKTQV